jgi:hypothetical protein
VVTLTARASDDCGLKSVVAEIDRGKGFRTFARLHDDGRHGDAVARDGLFTAVKKVRLRVAGAFPLRTTARNRLRTVASSAPIPLQVGP